MKLATVLLSSSTISDCDADTVVIVARIAITTITILKMFIAMAEELLDGDILIGPRGRVTMQGNYVYGFINAKFT